MDRIRFRARCGAGTYVRALARDLGETLGCGGHLEDLARTRSGPFRIEDAVRLEDLEGPEDASRRVIPFDEIPLPFPDVTISVEEAERVLHGSAVSLAGRVEPVAGKRPEWVCLRNPDGVMLAVASLEGPFLQPRVVFPDQ